MYSQPYQFEIKDTSNEDVKEGCISLNISTFVDRNSVIDHESMIKEKLKIRDGVKHAILSVLPNTYRGVETSDMPPITKFNFRLPSSTSSEIEKSLGEKIQKILSSKEM